jgi:hypothetical protein
MAGYAVFRVARFLSGVSHGAHRTAELSMTEVFDAERTGRALIGGR